MKLTNDPRKLMFVGKEVLVKDVAKKRSDIFGMVLQETKQTFLIKTSGGTITIPKKGNQFVVDAVTIDGKKILARHEDRLKV